MKKVIDGLIYDSDAGEHICTINNDFTRNDFKYERGSLYKTKNGRYFLCGYGGASSRFAVVLDDGGRTECISDTIVAIEENDARHLVERYGDLEDYILCFGEPKYA